MAGVEKFNFHSPDETRTPEKTRVEEPVGAYEFESAEEYARQ